MAPGVDTVNFSTTDHGIPDQQTKNRSPMIPAQRFQCPPMLFEAIPQRCARFRHQRVSSVPHHSWAATAARPQLAILKKEINPPLRPLHSPVAVGQEEFAAIHGFQSIQLLIELDSVVKTVHFPTAIAIACQSEDRASVPKRSRICVAAKVRGILGIEHQRISPPRLRLASRIRFEPGPAVPTPYARRLS